MRRRQRAIARAYWLPPRLRIRRLPEAVPISLGVFLFLTALLKGGSVPLCENPFETVNALMFPVEIVCGMMLLRPRWGRRAAALVWALLMPVAALYLAHMRHQGFDTRSCGCFGPVKLEFATHLLVLALLCGIAVAIFLREETRALDRRHGPEAGDARALRRLVRRF